MRRCALYSTPRIQQFIQCESCCRALYSYLTSNHAPPELYSLYSFIQLYTALYTSCILYSYTAYTLYSTIQSPSAPTGNHQQRLVRGASRTDVLRAHRGHGPSPASMEACLKGRATGNTWNMRAPTTHGEVMCIVAQGTPRVRRISIRLNLIPRSSRSEPTCGTDRS